MKATARLHTTHSHQSPTVLPDHVSRCLVMILLAVLSDIKHLLIALLTSSKYFLIMSSGSCPGFFCLDCGSMARISNTSGYALSDTPLSTSTTDIFCWISTLSLCDQNLLDVRLSFDKDMKGQRENRNTTWLVSWPTLYHNVMLSWLWWQNKGNVRLIACASSLHYWYQVNLSTKPTWILIGLLHKK